MGEVDGSRAWRHVVTASEGFRRWRMACAEWDVGNRPGESHPPLWGSPLRDGPPRPATGSRIYNGSPCCPGRCAPTGYATCLFPQGRASSGRRSRRLPAMTARSDIMAASGVFHGCAVKSLYFRCPWQLGPQESFQLQPRPPPPPRPSVGLLSYGKLSFSLSSPPRIPLVCNFRMPPLPTPLEIMTTTASPRPLGIATPVGLESGRL